MNEDLELLLEFVVESRESLDALDSELVALETNPSNAEALGSVFRTMHSIKGTAGFFGLQKLESVAHAGENLLAALRNGTIALERVRTTCMLAVVDAICAILDLLESTAGEGDEDLEILVDALVLAQEDQTLPQADELIGIVNGNPITTNRPDDPAPPDPSVAAASSHGMDDGPPPPPPEVDPGPAQGSQAPVHEVPAAAEPIRVPPDRASSAARSAAPDPVRASPSTPRGEARIRVDVALLDRLMNLVGELVLARNQLLQHASDRPDPGLSATAQRLDQITTELQEGVMTTRMQPIDKIWARYPRVVRDLALACRKQVQLEMEGRHTELDKSIIEAIADPLTHLVRNAIDHGIEAPSEREAADKATTGTVWLRAFHEGGRVNIEISDDGKGLDPEVLKSKAVDKGLITADDARRLSVAQAHQLLFLPGLSTADTVTNLSGRGVGMDVVRSNVEKIGGTVDIDSRKGAGTTIRIRIPLTLAIIPALMVGARGERFAVPQVNLQELMRLDADDATHTIERIRGAPVFRLRGQLLSLVDLGEVLALPEPGEAPDEINIVVLQADDRRFGLLVDTIHDTEEIVVKPLGRELKGIGEFAGATIMGDGRVALILDVAGLANRGNVRDIGHDVGSLLPSMDLDQLSDAASEMLLVFRAAGGSRMALPLESVARLEEFPAARVETVGNGRVIQYRGEILPLVDLSTTFGGRPSASDQLQVVVHSGHDSTIGFIVDEIEDVVRGTEASTGPSSRDGVRCTAVINGAVTELLDPDMLRAMAGGY